MVFLPKLKKKVWRKLLMWINMEKKGLIELFMVLKLPPIASIITEEF
jgi:hypothetical protein